MADWSTIDDPPSPPQRPEDGHKGTFGTVIVVGGSATMIGAPAICARATFRAGAGLVKVAGSSQVLTHAIVIEPGATGVLLEQGVGMAAHLAAIDAADPEAKAVLAVGPGLGQAAESAELVLGLLGGSRAVVLDADGLNLLAASQERLEGGVTVLTPHVGEFRRLAAPMGITADPTLTAERPAAAVALARAHEAVVVLKGRHTIVSDGDRVYTNASGNAALATAGTGDVLTGVIASLIGQGMEAFDAAALGVSMHGLAAERWVQSHGPCGLLARELADELPAVRETARAEPF